jgi:hypothetical protein
MTAIRQFVQNPSTDVAVNRGRQDAVKPRREVPGGASLSVAVKT